jgi:hypothetical protein
MRQLWDDIVEILTTPFVGEVDTLQLFLLVGLVIVFIFCWAMVLRYIQLAGQTIVEG